MKRWKGMTSFSRSLQSYGGDVSQELQYNMKTDSWEVEPQCNSRAFKGASIFKGLSETREGSQLAQLVNSVMVKCVCQGRGGGGGWQG